MDRPLRGAPIRHTDHAPFSNVLLGRADSATLLGRLKILLRCIGRDVLPVIDLRAQQRVGLDRMFPVHEVSGIDEDDHLHVGVFLRR